MDRGAVTQPPVSFAVLGLGRLGSCLARALIAANLPLKVVASARREVAEAQATQLGTNVRAVLPAELGQHAAVIFVTVPDAQVEAATSGLPLSAAHALVHTSGSLGLDVLAAVSGRGVRVGLMHPLQAFAAAAGPDRFHGIHMGVEANDPVLERQLEWVASALGGQAFSLRGVDRAAYHAAAVFVSNYVVALHTAAAQIWAQAGLPPESARAALAPLTTGAASAIAQHPLPAALTGPLVRGDHATIARHLQALKGDPALDSLYRALAEQLLTLSLGHSAAQRAALTKILREP